MTVLDPERRSRLLAVKLATLAREHLDVPGDAAGFTGGAALCTGGHAVVLADDDPGRSLGRALAWARQAGATTLDLLVDDAAGQLARRAQAFATPVTVWQVDGRDLRRAEPEPLPASPPPPAGALDLVPELVAAGADVVVEHGVVAGEVLGLEIARVVQGDDGLRIEAGVGRHDREAYAMLHGEIPTAQALANVVGAVRESRRPDRPDHPLQRLAPERWLRDVVVADPSLVGAAHLERHEGPLPRPSIKDPWPAVAVGVGAPGPGHAMGSDAVVVCSVGIDLDLVPFATDARLAADPDGRLVLVVPERDDHPVTRALAAALREPADVVAIPGDWRKATS